MKIKKLLPFALLLITFCGFSQERFKEKRDQIKALKVAFITNELALTADEATRFWPIYNTFEAKQNEIRIQKIKAYKDRIDDSNLDKLSEKEALALLMQMENTEDELTQLRKKFVSSLKNVIPSIKIIKLKRAEDNFNKKLLQQYRDKRRD